MNRITNLYRLTVQSVMVVLSYYGCKLLRRNPTKIQKEINNLYNSLIHVDGKIIEETQELFRIKFRNTNQIVIIRKSPSSDLNVFNQVFRDNEYAKVMELFKANFAVSLINIIDAGANVGYTSVVFNNHFSEVSIIAVEPSENNFKILKENISINYINAKLIHGGIWNKNAYLNLVRDFRDRSDWAIRVEESAVVTDLKAFSISEIASEANWKTIDILKIDIEGSEKNVFEKDADTSFLKMTKCIAIEIHDEFDCRETIYKILMEYGFSLQNVGETTIGINSNFIKKIIF